MKKPRGRAIMFNHITVPCIILWDFRITDQEVEIYRGRGQCGTKSKRDFCGRNQV